MKQRLFVIGMALAFIVSRVDAQQNVIITPSRTLSLDYEGTGAIGIALTTTPGTAITPLTILAQTIICSNVTTGAVVINATDTAGVKLINNLSIAQNATTTVLNSLAGIKVVGLKMWAEVASGVNCWITGKI